MPVSMPFGLSMAPYAWMKVFRPVVARLRELGVRLTVYAEEFCGRPLFKQGDVAKTADARTGWRQAEELF